MAVEQLPEEIASGIDGDSTWLSVLQFFCKAGTEGHFEQLMEEMYELAQKQPGYLWGHYGRSMVDGRWFVMPLASGSAAEHAERLRREPGAFRNLVVEICEGLLEADSGEVEVLGMRWQTDERALRELLGIQLQETQLSEKLTVAETVRLFRSFYTKGRAVEEVITLVQLEEKTKARVGTLSGGQKQRLAVACAIVGDPKLLFLDEPTTGLDPQSRRQLWDLITQFRAEGRTVVLTTH